MTRGHTLHEVSEVVCGDTSPQSVRWLADQIRARRFRARKWRGKWLMTDADIEFALDVCANGAVRVEESGPRVLSFAPTSARRRSA